MQASFTQVCTRYVSIALYYMYFRAASCVILHLVINRRVLKTHRIYLKNHKRQMYFVCLSFLDREDYVICFACGIGVKNWDSSCDPWSEHQKYKPKCPFLQTGLKDYRREIEVKTKLLQYISYSK